MARKFIVEDKDIIKLSDLDYKITGNEVRHIQVLRHKIGDVIIINNINFEIVAIKKKDITVKKLGSIVEDISRKCNVTLFQSFLKGDKMDTVIQKSVEIGTKSIVPFFSSNTIVKLDNKSKLKRKEKFEIIALEAIKQCGRTDDAQIDNFISFNEMVYKIKQYDLCIFAYEKETINIKDVIQTVKKTKRVYNNIAVIIGPEGGFTSNESEILKNIENVYTVSLGDIILKAETASVFVQSIIMYEFDK